MPSACPTWPGNTTISPDDLDRACAAQGVHVGEGDLLLVATGRDARRTEQRGRFDPIGDGMAGLHAECLPWLHERGVALLGGDGISDPMPGVGIHEWPFPIHQIGITRLGLMLIDNLRLDDLLDACARAERWEFLLTVGPAAHPRRHRLPGQPDRGAVSRPSPPTAPASTGASP